MKCAITRINVQIVQFGQNGPPTKHQAANAQTMLSIENQKKKIELRDLFTVWHARCINKKGLESSDANQGLQWMKVPPVELFSCYRS
jgi:hypothetical protein